MTDKKQTNRRDFWPCNKTPLRRDAIFDGFMASGRHRWLVPWSVFTIFPAYRIVFVPRGTGNARDSSGASGAE